MPFVCSMFLKFARQYSRNELLTCQWLGRNIGWPLAIPKSIMDLVHLEAVFDVLDLYLWLSYRFPDLFPDAEAVRAMQQELDLIIQKGVLNITQLLRAGMDSAAEEAERDDRPTSAPKLQGKLADRLLAQGLLTKEQLLELQREWQRTSPKDRRSKKPK
ncbi:hypothetical protein V5799_025024 [Amblyomma americanum]|uniref:ATP-dependent RNA helicase SUV3 C-terminal domain-containing protein n=1 Tax=Amblyomma americanum TaxID=6943 RepID=A0AAQ4EAS3_AMBAM